MFNGLFQLPFWGYVLVTVIVTQITIAAVTLYLHRNQAHKAFDMHPAISHFFRFWLWLTTGMVTGEWVAIHRKHHAKVETEDDPHSPQVYGIKKVLREGAELYRQEANNKETIARYSQGTPDDWLENNVYAKHPIYGVSLLVIVQFILFGFAGIAIWAIQMMWIPVWAAGVINGIGHYWGYRNSEPPDASRNISPVGFWIGGEELHNNHHAYPQSAKFSIKPWEFDIGWGYICIMKALGLAKVNHTAPTLTSRSASQSVDMESLKAIFAGRFEVLSQYSRTVMLPVLRAERQKASMATQRMLGRAKALLTRNDALVDDAEKAYLRTVLDQCQDIKIVYQYRQQLQAIWQRTSSSQKELLEALQDWCKRAEATGIEVLQQFAERLKSYSISLHPAVAT